MAGILDYSTTPSSNTTINGIGIAGSNSIKNGDDALRQIMADARSAVTSIVDKAAGSYTAAKSDFSQLWRVTGNATVNLTAAATLTAGWCMWVMADGGTATIDPAGTEQINGADTLTLTTGNSAIIICTGTAFRAIIFNKAFDVGTLGDAAFLDIGTTTGTVAAGDDSRITGALPKAGGTMTGALTLFGAPSANLHAATKKYVDDAVKSYTSGEQTITSGGSLTLAHGLGARPSHIQASLICKTAENGYSVGDEVYFGAGVAYFNGSSGHSLVADETYITVRMSNYTKSYVVTHKSTGAYAELTNANWRLIVRAFK